MSLKLRILILLFILIGINVALVLMIPKSNNDTLQAAFDAEFLSRPDGYPGLIKHYEFQFRVPPIQMDPGLMYRALVSSTVDVIDGFATDGRIPAYGLVTLKDDKGFFPPYYAVPVIREETLQKYPEIRGVLDILSHQIDDSTMQQLNFHADEKGQKARDIACAFLKQKCWFHPGTISKDYAEPIVIGGKHFTEQEIIGEILALLLETNLGIPIERKLNMGGTMICFNALRSGDIDLYVEYTGTGLINILKKKTILDPDEAYKIVKESFKKKYKLVWLAPLGFNNTYTLTMEKNAQLS